MIGNPLPDVTWYRDQKDVIETSRCTMSRNGSTYSLTIKDAALTDEAEYTAVAHSKFGKVTSSAMVTVKQVESKPVFEKKLDDAKAVVGYDVALSAKFKGHPEPKVEFYHNNKILFSSEKYTITSGSATGECSLKISKSELKDYGQYKCTIRNKLGQATCFAKVSVSEPVLSPQFTLGLVDTECAEGKDVTLKVEFSGKPKPVITWYRNGDALKQFGRFRTKTDGNISTLSLNRAKLDESSEIRCVACNEGAQIETTCKLRIMEELKKPEFIYSPKNLKVFENGAASLRATFNGKPTPEIEWFKDEEVITSSKNYEVKNDGLKTTLNIKGCTSSMAGKYKCQATNKAGSSSCAAVLTVEEALSRPEFVKGLKDVRFKEGDSIVLEVTSKGNPSPTVQWFKSEKLIISSKEIILETTANSYLLRIPLCNAGHSGMYKAVAKNKMGECISRGKLSIDQNAEKPVFKRKLVDIDLNDADTARLEVEISGKPSPKLTWFHDSNEVQFSKRCQLEKSADRQTLVISDICPKDEGTYECIAENIAGRTSCMSFLKIKEPLFAPEFAVAPENAIVAVGESATINFVVVGNPRAELSVLKGGENVGEKVRMMIDGVTGEGRMIVNNFTVDDSGVYQIVALNPEGKSECEFALECPAANNSPFFRKPLPDVHLKVGESAVLAVEFGGNVLDVDWYKDDQYITDSEKYEIIDEEYRCTLAIHDCRKEDEGVYRCEIGNDEAHSFSEARLTVKPAGRRLSGQRVIEETVMMQEVSRVETAPQNSKMMPEVNREDKVKPEEKKPEDSRKLEEKKKQETTAEPAIKPEFVTPLVDCSYSEGDNVTLQVTVTGVPLPEVTWFKGPQQVRKSARIMTRKDSNEARTLIIRDVDLNDSGEYKCVATNKHGSVFSKATMLVTKPTVAPKFLRPPKDLRLMEGDSIVLETSVSGNPVPAVKCRFRGENNNAKDMLDLVTSGVVAKLVINNCQMENSGTYEFTAENEAGQASCEVKVAIRLEETKLGFTQKLKNTKAERGKSLQLTAICEGKPKKDVAWEKDGSPVVMDKKISQKVSGDKLTLTFAKFEPADVGVYTCAVKNSLGSDMTRFNVEMQESSSRPIFKKKLTDVTVEEASKIELSVELDGSPEPSVKWTKDSMNVREGGRIRTEREDKQHKLIIANANRNDKGMYCCTAKNSNAEVKTSCIVFVSKNLKGKPSFMNAKAAFESKSDISNKGKSKAVSPPISPPIEKPVKLEAQKPNKSVPEGKITVSEQKRRDEVQTEDQIESVETKIMQKVEHKVEAAPERAQPAKVETRGAERRDSKMSDYSQPSSRRSSTSSTSSSTPRGGTAPLFIKSLESSTCPEGLSRALSVVVKGNPEPEVQWLHNGRLLSKGRSYDIEKGFRGDHRLKVKGFNASLSGKYTAVAINEAGKAECEAMLELKGKTEIRRASDEAVLKKEIEVQLQADRKPSKAETVVKNENENDLRFTKSLADVEIYEGKEAVLEVAVEGALPVTCKWERDGKPVRNTLSTRCEKKGNVCTLKIGRPAKSEGGKYAAVVSNSKATITSTCIVKVVAAPVKPSFLLKLRDINIFEGKDMEVSAKVNGKPDPEVKWYLNGEELENGGRYSIVRRPDGRQIFKMSGLTMDDNGELKCEASNPGGTAVCTSKIAVRGSSRPAGMSVTLPTFTKQLENVTFAEDGLLSLCVETTGSPSITWYKDSKQMLKSTRIQIASIDNKHSLKIAKCRIDDGGTYRVVVRNRAGEKSCTATVVVTRSMTAPVLKRGLDKVRVRDGETAQLRTRFEGTGLSVEWLKDGSPIKPAKNSVMSEMKNEFELKIPKVRSEDSGEYECVATNDAGSVSSTGELIVEEMESPASFVRKIEEVNINEGESLELMVEVAGSPKPKVKFSKDGKDVHMGTVSEERDSVWKLEIKKTGLSDSGLYTCKAWNKVSTVSCSSTVNIKRSTTPPRFSTLLDEKNVVEESGELRLEVLAIGDPQPDVEWLRRSRKLKTSDDIEITKGELNSLVLRHAKMEDAGEYKCIATNAAGKCEKTFYVVVEGKRLLCFPKSIQRYLLLPYLKLILLAYLKF